MGQVAAIIQWICRPSLEQKLVLTNIIATGMFYVLTKKKTPPWINTRTRRLDCDYNPNTGTLCNNIQNGYIIIVYTHNDYNILSPHSLWHLWGYRHSEKGSLLLGKLVLTNIIATGMFYVLTKKKAPPWINTRTGRLDCDYNPNTGTLCNNIQNGYIIIVYTHNDYNILSPHSLWHLWYRHSEKGSLLLGCSLVYRNPQKTQYMAITLNEGVDYFDICSVRHAGTS